MIEHRRTDDGVLREIGVHTRHQPVTLPVADQEITVVPAALAG